MKIRIFRVYALREPREELADAPASGAGSRKVSGGSSPLFGTHRGKDLGKLRSLPFAIHGGFFRHFSARRALSGVFRTASSERVHSWPASVKRATPTTARSASRVPAT